jgi:hypothetical protein
VVEALRLVSLVTERAFGLNFKNPPNWADLPRRCRGLSPSLQNIEIHKESLFHRYGDPPALIKADFASGTRLAVHIGSTAAIHAVFYDKKGLPIVTHERLKKAGVTSVSILPQISPLAEDETILRPEYVRANLATSRSSLHFRNQLNLYQERFSDFKKLAEQTWHGLRIRELGCGRGIVSIDHLSLIVQDGDFSAEISWMGHGLQMWLQTMWFLARTPTSATVILDEPDVYMHADLQRRLIRMLKHQSSKQVIIATHSAEIMAEVEADEILLVDRKRKASSFAGSMPTVQKILENVGSVHNLAFARLATSRLLLLVEGEDIPFLKRFQDKVFPETARPIDIIPSMRLGGWSGWNYAVGIGKLIKTTDRKMAVLCILDRDFHTEEEIEERKIQSRNLESN